MIRLARRAPCDVRRLAPGVRTAAGYIARVHTLALVDHPLRPNRRIDGVSTACDYLARIHAHVFADNSLRADSRINHVGTARSSIVRVHTLALVDDPLHGGCESDRDAFHLWVDREAGVAAVAARAGLGSLAGAGPELRAKRTVLV